MNNALVGKRVAITGTLSVPRQYVYKLLKAVGATPTNLSLIHISEPTRPY